MNNSWIYHNLNFKIMRQLIKLLALVIVVGISFSSCKEKKVKKTVPKKTVVKKDTVKPKPVKVVKEEPKPAAPQKYFLIRGVFEYKHRADAFYEKLVADGYDARIFMSDDGFFRRISYMGFSDKAEALAKLEEERAKEETKDVWLYIPTDSFE